MPAETNALLWRAASERRSQPGDSTPWELGPRASDWPKPGSNANVDDGDVGIGKWTPINAKDHSLNSRYTTDLGIPADYGRQRGLPLQLEARDVVSLGPN